MDYPVLVNSGKPLIRDAHEKENQGDRSRGRETPQNRRGGAQGRCRSARSRPERLRGSPATPPDDAKRSIRRLRAQLAQAQARIEELQASADTDFLLDIPNRRGFERELNRSIAYIKRYHASGALIVLDVDRLKPINDAFGHAAGDQVLKAVVAALCATCARPT